MSIQRYLPQLSEQQLRWLRFGAVLLSALLLLWIANWLHAVLTPLVAALALAYILNPAVTWLEKRFDSPRVVVVSAGLIVLLTLLVLLLAAATLQVIQLIESAPGYIARIDAWVREELPSLLPAAGVTDGPNFAELLRTEGLRLGGAALAFTTGLLSNAFYWASLGVLLPMYTYFFLLNFNQIVRTARDHLPAESRPTIIEVVQTIDRSVASFFRGRITVCFFVGLLTGIGWLIVGVPYNLALGLLAGVLNLVPFMSFLALPPALILCYLHEVDAGGNWIMGLVGVMAVYLTVQAIESFILTPLIEAQASGLHPVTTIVALLIGGQIAGLLGMLLAIPIASTLKSLGRRYVLPEIRNLANPAPEPPPPESSTVDDTKESPPAPAEPPAPPRTDSTA